MTRPQQEAHCVGRHQAYKTDQPAYGDGRGRYKRSKYDDEQFVALDM